MKRIAQILSIVVALASSATRPGQAVTIPTVPVGNPGNPADTRYYANGLGSVGYNFRTGQTEITNAQYVEFLNAVAKADPYQLYTNSNMSSNVYGGIVVSSGLSGSYTYAVKAPALGGAYTYDDKPVVWVSWGDAARFANWLHNGQPTGPEGPGTTEDGAYTLNGAMTNEALLAVTRKPAARWWIPSEDEWYKAAYHKNDGVTANYWDYPTRTNSMPNNHPPSSDTGNSVNTWTFDTGYTSGDANFPLTNAGAYTLSGSPYGTFDQGGNAWEWNEQRFSIVDLTRGTGTTRGIRGGDWSAGTAWTRASSETAGFGPTFENYYVTFRVATVIPEPSAVLLLALGTAGMLTVRRRVRTLYQYIAIGMFALWCTSPNVARADIYQWEYINQADPSQGQQQSTTLAPDGAGVSAVPGADLGYRDLTKAYLPSTNLTNASLYFTNLMIAYLNQANLQGADLTNANLSSDLTDANLNQANLTNAILGAARLNGADFSGAYVRGANFSDTTSRGFVAAQLYSTASFQVNDLTGINFDFNNVTGWNFAGQNLTNASFIAGTLTGADFTGADVRGANFHKGSTSTSSGLTVAQLYSTATYQAHDMTGINLEINNLAGGNFANQNLTNAKFAYAILSGADFTGEMRGATFSNTTLSGFTAAQLYSTASYQAHDITGIALDGTGINLAGWNFASQNITNARFADATLTGTDFTGAEMRGASFSNTTSKGFTATQLYSTTSYQAHDLIGIALDGNSNDLAGWHFAGQNLTNANFSGSGLTGADFAGADVRGASFQRNFITTPCPRGLPFCFPFTTAYGGISPPQLSTTASYQAGDLTGIRLVNNDLTGTNFAGKNLKNADLHGATLTSADFSGAEIRGASFGRYSISSGCDRKPTYNSCRTVTNSFGSGVSLAQLAASASYLAHDLTGIDFSGNDLSGGNFVGQNLSGASFLGTRLSNADLSLSIMANTVLRSATLTGVNLWGADSRGAFVSDGVFPGAVLTSFIQPDGRVSGLDVGAGQLFVVRDYDGDPTRTPTPLAPIAIAVDQRFTMAADSILRMLFESDAWNSTISFTSGIPVTRGGTLEILFADGTDPSSQIGRTFKLFNWNGVAPTGTFNVVSPFAWNLSKLYTTGEVTLAAVPEPSALAQLLIAVVGVLTIPRRWAVDKNRC